LKLELEKLAADPFERRSFVYLDIIAWLQSKVEGKTVEAMSRKKFLERELGGLKKAAILK
jgi:asparagine synthetase B (glutamine-hydrolysing)